MNMKQISKRIALAGLLLVLLLGISGCLTKPDKVEELPTPPVDAIYPFPTTTPSPPPTEIPTQAPSQVDPNATGTDADGGQVQVVTNAPTTQAPIVVISPSPTPIWTYSPSPTATPTDGGVLRNGSTGQAVRALQERLKALGYLSGSVDGDYGAATEAAVKEFQRVNGLTADGVAGAKTLETVNSSNAKSKPKATATPKPTTDSRNATARPTPKSYTPSTPGKYGYLQLGSSGSDVKNLQNRLKELGYFKGTVNGSYGEDTEAAVTAFQKRNGQWADGKAGPDTQEALYSNDALAAPAGSSTVPIIGYRILASGDTGQDVTLVQARLQELGYYQGEIDGTYGTSTAAAVKLFQQQNGLTAEDILGIGAMARLFSENALYAATENIASSRTSVTATMELGSMGDDVYRLQERLYEMGYYSDRIDGIYSETVQDAVRAFQQANKLTADGKAGRKTQTLLYSDQALAATANLDDTYAALREGDSGERVRALQTLLAGYGYFTDTVDGQYSAATAEAVRQLQISNGLLSDGVAGPATLQLLYQGTPVHAQTAIAASAASTTTTAYDTLKQGMSGSDVMMLQQFLAEFGYYYDEQSGEYDGPTLLAVQAFQSRNGLEPDGVAGSDTLALLYSGEGMPSETFGLNITARVEAENPTQAQTQRTTMREGDEGQDVFTMQERLQTLGYLDDAPDGVYGSATITAVQAFQEKNGLKIDGVASKAAVNAMYAAGVIPNYEMEPFVAVDNSNRELQEQSVSGVISGSLAGGGVAASYNSSVYYTGKEGKLYISDSKGSRLLYDGKVSDIHASERGVTFISGSKILRIPIGGTRAETLATVGGLKKMTMVGSTLVYLEGSTLMRANPNMDSVVLAKNVTSFTVDVFQKVVYTACADGIRTVPINGTNGELIASTKADQVQIADSIVFFRNGKNIYRMQEGVPVLFMEMECTWMGIYRDYVYYISGGDLYRIHTDGDDNTLFYDGQVANVSFVSGKVYITARDGGEITEIIDV